MLGGSERLSRYKSAVYLNNSAVALMSHRQHDAAMETLSDALSLIKTMVEPSSILSSHEIREFAIVRVHQAEQRLARLCTTTATTHNCTTDTTTTVPLKMASYDGSLSSCPLNLRVAKTSGDSNHTYHTNAYAVAITIDDSPNDELCRCIQEITPTIMLSNFALAHLYVSLSMPSLAQRQRVRNGARRMLDIGQAVLGVPQRTMHVTEGNMFLALVLAQNICCLHQQHESCLSFDDDSKRSDQHLYKLRKLSRQMIQLTSGFIPLAGAA
jgi:hypothetical protein